MKAINILYKILILTGLTFGLLMHTNSISAQNTSPLCFTARSGSVTVRFDIKNVTHTIQYSTNRTTWNTYTSNTNVTINANQSIYFRAETNQTAANPFGSTKLNTCSRFYFTSANGGTVEGSGNIMSLYGPGCPNLPLQWNAFAFLFDSCTLLTAAPALPATALHMNCYGSMFKNCTSLTASPALPATRLVFYCYWEMFYGCTSLIAAPALPATTLVTGCYWEMFLGCTSLTAAPALPATTLAGDCYSGMFAGCTSLTAAPALPATTLADDCYNGMFADCTSLTAAPALPATTLADGCYIAMFAGCTSLTTAPALPATTLADWCYKWMFERCTSLTTAPTLPATTLAEHCCYCMFMKCTSLKTAPALPATTLAKDCYHGMFAECTSLKVPPSLPATTLAEECYVGMFQYCTSMVVNFSGPGTPWRISATVTAPNALSDMFTGTSGTMKRTPSVNTTYYIGSGSFGVSVYANDSTIGTVTGGGTYDSGESVRITATAIDSCYSFDRWSDGDTSNPRTFVITNDTSFTALFKKNIYTVAVSPNRATAGVVYCNINGRNKSSVTVECGETVEIHAESTDRYYFAGWSDGGMDSIRVITVTSDTNLVAMFKAHCGDETHWPVELKFNNLLIINLNVLNADGYYPQADRISWYKVVGDVDAVEGSTFPVDDQYISRGYYMSLIANGMGGGSYYAVIDASQEAGTPCEGDMKSDIVEYIPGSKNIRVNVVPTKVRNGEHVTVSGLSPDEVSMVRVYDYTGKLIETIETSGTEQCQIRTAGCAGVYMINVTSENINETFKFVVTK